MNGASGHGEAGRGWAFGLVDVFRSAELERDQQDRADAGFRLQRVGSLEAGRGDARGPKRWQGGEH